jgi:hypothetical protein
MHLTSTTASCYRKPLAAWDDESWIRSKPARRASCEGFAFSPELVPIAQHPRFAENVRLRERLLAFRLLTHLQFTTVLELAHVNAVCARLARDQYALDLTRDQKLDALRIYCDEGGHALFVELLSDAIERRHGIERSVLPKPRFHQVLEDLFVEQGSRMAPELLHLFFVSVSETLVTKILRDIPRDPRVAPLVREVIGDHARDEGTHSVYFHWLFPKAWERLRAQQQELLGQILPRFLEAFLAPDMAGEARILQALGLKEDERQQVLAETYDPSGIRQAVRAAAQPTLRLFEGAGVFDRPSVADAFLSWGLYLESQS